MDVVQLELMAREELEAEITALAGHLAAAECRWLLLVAEYDRREGWLQWGCRSCSYWLSWKCGLDLRTAQQKLKVAHALSLFPHIRATFAVGKLSYSKVRALVRCAGPDTEQDLVEMALRATAAHMESISRGYRRTERAEDRADGDLATRRRVEFSDDVDDPELRVMVAHLTVEECEIVHDALARAKAEGLLRPDAVVAMAESYLAHGDACRTGADRASITVVTDESVLLGDDAGAAHVLGGHGLLPETVRRLACDATFRWVLRDRNGELVDVSSQHANLPRAVRHLVGVRDDGRCQFPGCAERRYTDVHHIVHRADGGTHDATNLTTLCWFHHRLVHEGGWSIKRHLDTSELVAITPNGDTMTTGVLTIDDTDGDRIIELNTHHGIDIDPHTVIPQWGGERLDLGWAVTSLWYANHPDRLAAEVAADRTRISPARAA